MLFNKKAEEEFMNDFPTAAKRPSTVTPSTGGAGYRRAPARATARRPAPSSMRG